MTKQFSQEELDSLTEEELAGLMDDEANGAADGAFDAGSVDGGAADDGALSAEQMNELDAQDDEDTDVDEEELERILMEEDGTAGDDEGAGGGNAGSGTADDVAVPAAGDGTIAGDDAPSWILPTDVNQQIDTIEAKLTDLATQFDDGMLTATELREQQKALENEREALRDQKRYADFQFRADKERYVKQTVPSFMEAHPIYEQPLFQSMLDQEVKRLQMQAKNPFNPHLLELAHQRIAKAIREGYGVNTGAKPTLGQKPTQATPPKRQLQPPPTLHNVPAAAISQDNSQFAYLNRLAETDYLKYEAELEKLAPHVREQFLEMG